MKVIHALAVAGLLQIMCGCASRKTLPSFFFIQMADTQFGFFNDDRDFSKETANFEKAIGEANRLRPRFVVVCGDLVNRPGDAAQIAEYKRIASKLNPAIKLYNVAGNHDVGNIPTPQSLEKYRAEFGPDYYTFEEGNIVGIVVNSSLMKDPDSAALEAAAQDKWLRAALEQAKAVSGAIVMIFQHHSLFLTDPQEKDDYFNFDRQTRGRYLDLFSQYGVRYVFAGHYHRNAAGRAPGLEMITTGPVGKPLGLDPSGFRIVTVEGDNIRHTYHSLNSVQETVGAP